jgi:hypothetical protein
VTSLHETGIPAGAEIVTRLRSLVGRWYAREPELVWEAAHARLATRSNGSLIEQIEHLASINCFQWHLEDECRASYGDPARLGHLKQGIDASNGRRVRSIDAIDDRVSDIVARRVPDRPECRFALATPGAVIDRLSVLELRLARLRASHDGADLTTATSEQIDEIAGAFDLLIEDLLASRQRMHVYRTVKLYS